MLGTLDLSADYQYGNKLRIILYSSLRNLLGPHHHIDGELTHVSPESFLPYFDLESDYAENVKRWDNNAIEPIDWKDSYCLTDFANIGKICLQF